MITALDHSGVLIATRTIVTGVRIQDNQAIKIQPGTDTSLLPADDFRKQIFHPLIVGKVGLNMFSRAIAEVKAVVFEVGQNTGTTSVLVVQRYKQRLVRDWQANDERLKNWDPLTSTLDDIEKLLGVKVGVQEATAGSVDNDMRENTDKRTRGTDDVGQEDMTSADAEDKKEEATAANSKKKKRKKSD